MGMTIEFSAPANTARVDEIGALARAISEALDRIAQELGVEPGTTHAVLADDFASAVEATSRQIASLRRGADHQPFTVERLGGVVVGKTHAQDDSYPGRHGGDRLEQHRLG